MTKAEAEHQITRVLQEFETSTGQLVNNIRIVNLDISELEDERQQVLSIIRLELQPVRDRRWS